MRSASFSRVSLILALSMILTCKGSDGQLLAPLMSLAGGLASNLNPFTSLAQSLTGGSSSTGGGLLSGLRSAASSPVSYSSAPSAMPSPSLPFGGFGAASSVNYGANSQIPMLTPFELAEIMHSQAQSESSYGSSRAPVASNNVYNNVNSNYNSDSDDDSFEENNSPLPNHPMVNKNPQPLHHSAPSNHVNNHGTNLPPMNQLARPIHTNNVPPPPMPPPAQFNYQNSPPRPPVAMPAINIPNRVNHGQYSGPPAPPAPVPTHQPLYNSPRAPAINDNYGNSETGNGYNNNNNYNNDGSNNSYRSPSSGLSNAGSFGSNYQRSPSNNNINNDYDRPYDNEGDYDRPSDNGNSGGNNYDGPGRDYDSPRGAGPIDDTPVRGYRVRSPSYQDDLDAPNGAARDSSVYSSMNNGRYNGAGSSRPAATSHSAVDNGNSVPISAAGGYDEAPTHNSAPIAYNGGSSHHHHHGHNSHGNYNHHSSNQVGNRARSPVSPQDQAAHNRPNNWSYNSMHNSNNRPSPASASPSDDSDENDDSYNDDRNGPNDDSRPVEYRRSPSSTSTSLYGYYNTNDFNKLNSPNHQSHRHNHHHNHNNVNNNIESNIDNRRTRRLRQPIHNHISLNGGE